MPTAATTRLRCAALYDKDPYLHDGRAKTLREALTGPHSADSVTGLGELSDARARRPDRVSENPLTQDARPHADPSAVREGGDGGRRLQWSPPRRPRSSRCTNPCTPAYKPPLLAYCGGAKS